MEVLVAVTTLPERAGYRVSPGVPFV